MSEHSVFVIGIDGEPLTPTTPAKARKLLKAGVVKKKWSKFGTFGIQMLVETRTETPETTLGVDNGTKFEGYAVVCGTENVLAVKQDLPDKKKIVRKMEERSTLRRARRNRKCRRRKTRFDNRTRKSDWLAPSQQVMVQSRIKLMESLFAIYPIGKVASEEVRFNHAAKRWGANFSTIEIGKTKIREWLRERAELVEFQGHETESIRKLYGYRKTRVKSADKFTAHCSDALALAVHIGCQQQVQPGLFLVVDDTYRPVRRKLHDTQPAKGGIRAAYSRGTVFGLRKGLLIGTTRSKQGRLCGEYKGGYRYYDAQGKRQSTKQLAWGSLQYIVRKGACAVSPVT